MGDNYFSGHLLRYLPRNRFHDGTRKADAAIEVSKYTGMALGTVIAIGSLGSLVAPPLGNSLAATNAGLPFIFWAGMSAVPLFGLPFIKETGRKRNKN